MKESIILTVASTILAVTAVHAAENPGPISKQAEIFLANRAAVLPPKEDLIKKSHETSSREKFN